MATKSDDDLRPEYDFSKLQGGMRSKYAERYKRGTVLAPLDSDVTRAFPTAKAVNDALRVLIKIAKEQVQGE